jgi:hypothetical protein
MTKANPKQQGILLPGFPFAQPLNEVVLFGFDNRAFPFQHGVQTHLIEGSKSKIVVRHGAEGSHDEFLLYYGTVIHIEDQFHMWYFGKSGKQNPSNGSRQGSDERKTLCYAISEDGIHWEKPNLGLVEFKGSTDNNRVDFPEPSLRSAAAILYEPEESNPARRFKMVYEADRNEQACMCIAFSPDGLRWTPSELNPVGAFCEMAGLTKFNGIYYMNGQGALRAHQPFMSRKLITFASKDFEHWSPCAAVGLDRSPDLTGPSTQNEWNNHEEVHLGAGLWNRGNVILGIYGQWHGHSTGDRRHVGIDLGLTITHNAIHHYEPIPGYKLIPAREHAESPTEMPSLMQGQGMENVGDSTYYWYSFWRANEGTGVRLATWERDRLGMLKPYTPVGAMAVTCAVKNVGELELEVFVNASGLGAHSQIRVNVLDDCFRPVQGYSGEDGAVISNNGLREAAIWTSGSKLPDDWAHVYFQTIFEGVRPEDCRLHAIYVTVAAASVASI